LNSFLKEIKAKVNNESFHAINVFADAQQKQSCIRFDIVRFLILTQVKRAINEFCRIFLHHHFFLGSNLDQRNQHTNENLKGVLNEEVRVLIALREHGQGLNRKSDKTANIPILNMLFIPWITCQTLQRLGYALLQMKSLSNIAVWTLVPLLCSRFATFWLCLVYMCPYLIHKVQCFNFQLVDLIVQGVIGGEG